MLLTRRDTVALFLFSMDMSKYGRVWPQLPWGALGYVPNAAQKPIVTDDARIILICGGERSGKSYTTAAMFLKRCMVPDGRFWIIGPDYEHSRKEFEYIEYSLEKLGFISKCSKPMEGTWRMETTWGAHIQTRSSNKERSIASEALHGALMTEAGQQTEEAWLKTRGRLADHRGWLIMSGTLEDGFPWYIDLLNRWKGENVEGGSSYSLPTWSNTDIFPGGEEDPEIKALRASMPLDRFNEKYGAIPSKPSGLVFPQFDVERHVRSLQLELDGNGKPLPVELAIDPATHTYAVLFVQQAGNKVHVLDEVYTHGQIAQEVIPKVMAHPLYSYVTGGVGDFAVRQRHGTYSQEQIWLDKTGLVLRSNRWSEPDVRDAVAYRLQLDSTDDEPGVYFNSHMTSAIGSDGRPLGVLGEFNTWRWRDHGYGRSEIKRPVDFGNDGLKALGYWFLDTFGSVGRRRTLHKGIRKKGYRRGVTLGQGQNIRVHPVY